MNNIQGKINKLCMALKINKKQTYLIDKRQFYNDTFEKVCTLIKINRLMPTEEYNKIHPFNKKNSKKYKYVKEEIYSSTSNIKILKKLAELYKEAGGSSG